MFFPQVHNITNVMLQYDKKKLSSLYTTTIHIAYLLQIVTTKTRIDDRF